MEALVLSAETNGVLVISFKERSNQYIGPDVNFGVDKPLTSPQRAVPTSRLGCFSLNWSNYLRLEE
jgi:hypothetical protein